MKKTFVILLVMILAGSMLLTSCCNISEILGDELSGTTSDIESSVGEESGPQGGNQGGNDEDNQSSGNGITLNMSGKEAAELLLSRVRLDENKIGASISFVPSGESTMKISDAPYISLLSATNKYEVVYLSESDEDMLEDFLANDGFDMEGDTWIWRDLKDYSNDLSFYQSYLTSITGVAKSYANTIQMIKERINITDRWIDMHGSKILLTVSESSEVIYQVDSYSLNICNHYVDEGGRDVYEMYSRYNYEDGDMSESYMVYIDGEYYEYSLDYTPGDGNWAEYYRPRVIMDRTRGYWNMFCMTDAAYPPEEGGRFFNVGNLVATDEAIYQFQASMREGKTLGEEYISYSVISPDMKNDILSYNPEVGELTLNLNGIKDVECIRLDTANKGNSYADEIFGYGDRRPTYLASGQDIEVVLQNGKVLKYGDTYAGGKIAFSNVYVTADLGQEKYYAELALRIVDKDSLSVDDLVLAVSEMMIECGMEPPCSLDVVSGSLKSVITFAESFSKFYEWNGYKVDSPESVIAATEVLVEKFAGFEEMYEAVQDMPVVDVSNHLQPLPDELDFADFSAFDYGKITISDGVITAEEMIASVADHVLFDDESEYVLRLGLRKYLEDGMPSETIVVLHGDNESFVAHEGEKAMAFFQGSNYTIPANLSEGTYLLVAFIATADEGIRVTTTIPMASIDFENGTVSSDVADITYEKVEDNMLVVISRSKLYTEITLEGEFPYDQSLVAEQLSIAAMSSGMLIDGALVELYNFETGEAEVLAEDFELIPGVYRLKYKSAAHDGADAYVYCVVTEEMLITPPEESESSGESESADEDDSSGESSGESESADEDDSSGESSSESEIFE